MPEQVSLRCFHEDVQSVKNWWFPVMHSLNVWQSWLVNEDKWNCSGAPSFGNKSVFANLIFISGADKTLTFSQTWIARKITFATKDI